MDQTTSDKTAGLVQDLDMAHSVAIESDLEKTNDVLEQDETLVQDKQALIIPLSTEKYSSLRDPALGKAGPAYRPDRAEPRATALARMCH